MRNMVGNNPDAVQLRKPDGWPDAEGSALTLQVREIGARLPSDVQDPPSGLALLIDFSDPVQAQSTTALQHRCQSTGPR